MYNSKTTHYALALAAMLFCFAMVVLAANVEFSWYCSQGDEAMNRVCVVIPPLMR